MASKNPPIRRALLSVFDKDGLIEFATALSQLEIELISTGGTAKAIKEAGLDVMDVSDITGFPEMMDGRVKTLHPKIHGGLLALRDNDEHKAAQTAHDIANIDLLIVNLYPFEETIARTNDYDTAIENIDIGGPAMIRAAAKNHRYVGVVTDKADYDGILAEIKNNARALTTPTLKKLAAKAFAHTARYDGVISTWFAGELNDEAPEIRIFGGQLAETLRYGENPHQTAAFYKTPEDRPGVATARQVQGKSLSYNNINDTDAAFECVSEFDPAETAAVAIIKHANPCGVAIGADLLSAYTQALRCDPTSAFGGIVALNQTIGGRTADEIIKTFTEVIIAPDADEEALKIIARKDNLRLLLTGGIADPHASGLSVKSVSGGLLVQSRDNIAYQNQDLKTVTKRAPSAREMNDLLFAFKICKHVKSNAIIYAKDGATVGIGAGQMSRIDSARIAARKSADAAKSEGSTEPLAKGSVVASDAFFPFADGLIQAAEAGATAVIQPGGSIRDEEVIEAADKAGLAMVFTKIRHFRH